MEANILNYEKVESVYGGFIIDSLLDLDFYKLTMLKAMYLKHPDLCGEYDFKCRNKGVRFTPKMIDEIRQEFEHLCTLRFTKEELDYLANIKFGNRPAIFRTAFLSFLKLFRFDMDNVNLGLDGAQLKITFSGPICHVMLWEIFTLEIVSEVYARNQKDHTLGEQEFQHLIRLEKKINDFKSGRYTFKFADFGTRRRKSKEVFKKTLQMLMDCGNCIGTSNVYEAMKRGINPVGTYAHEYVQMFQGIPGVDLAYTNKMAMDEWFEVYNGDVGCALTDTLTTDLFLLDLGYKEMMLFKSFRHDSGDPYDWGDKMIKKIESYGIDPMTKTLLFSDSLDMDKAQAIYDYFEGRVGVAFGIGTFFMNDDGIVPALNIVCKLQTVTASDGVTRNVAKLSDNPDKAMCRDPKHIEYLKRCVEYRKTIGA